MPPPPTPFTPYSSSSSDTASPSPPTSKVPQTFKNNHDKRANPNHFTEKRSNYSNPKNVKLAREVNWNTTWETVLKASSPEKVTNNNRSALSATTSGRFAAYSIQSEQVKRHRHDTGIVPSLGSEGDSNCAEGFTKELERLRHQVNHLWVKFRQEESMRLQAYNDAGVLWETLQASEREKEVVSERIRAERIQCSNVLFRVWRREGLLHAFRVWRSSVFNVRPVYVLRTATALRRHRTLRRCIKGWRVCARYSDWRRGFERKTISRMQFNMVRRAFHRWASFSCRQSMREKMEVLQKDLQSTSEALHQADWVAGKIMNSPPPPLAELAKEDEQAARLEEEAQVLRRELGEMAHFSKRSIETVQDLSDKLEQTKEEMSRRRVKKKVSTPRGSRKLAYRAAVDDPVPRNTHRRICARDSCRGCSVCRPEDFVEVMPLPIGHAHIKPARKDKVPALTPQVRPASAKLRRSSASTASESISSKGVSQEALSRFYEEESSRRFR